VHFGATRVQAESSLDLYMKNNNIKVRMTSAMMVAQAAPTAALRPARPEVRSAAAQMVSDPATALVAARAAAVARKGQTAALPAALRHLGRAAQVMCCIVWIWAMPLQAQCLHHLSQTMPAESFESFANGMPRGTQGKACAIK
jgi:hypothetical protein